ncbi:MAG: O-antigen ligase family protein [Clostridia bacterium]|nr:O-antigen ligase family protein [Clostridia bacterium]
MTKAKFASTEKIAKARAFLNKFFLSDYYIVLLAVLTFVGWLSGAWIPFLFVTLSLTIIMFTVCENTMPVFPFMWFFLYTISTTQQDLGKYGWMLFLTIPLVGAIVYNFVHNKPKIKSVLMPKNIKSSTFSMFLLLIPMSLGGLFRSGRNASAALIVVALTAVLAFSFAYYMAIFRERKGDKNDILKYMIKIMFVSSLIVTAQITVASIQTGNTDSFIELVKYKLLDLGWSSPNPAAAAITLGIPASFYYMLKRKKYAFVFLIIAALQYLAIIITGSRGALLFAGIALPIMLLYTLIKTENRKQLIIASGVFVLIIAVVAGVLYKQIYDALSIMLSKGMSDNGRFDIYLFGLKIFSENPVFGAGWDFGLGDQHVGYSPFLFHSTVLQILACSGIVGMLVYIYFYYARYSTFFKTAFSPEKAAIFTAMAIFEAYGIIDPILFIPPTFFIMLLTLSVAVEQAAPDNINTPIIIKKFRLKLQKKSLAKTSD